MMIFWEAGLVLLAVPKTGTQAYAAALGDIADVVVRNPPRLKHITAQRFAHKLRPILPKQDLTIVAVIREPADWLGSWYRYRSRPALAGHPNSTAEMSFADFVEAHLRDRPPACAEVGAQFRFLTGRDGALLVDHLFAYEDQPKLRAFLGDRLDRDLDVPPQRNVSPEADLTLPGDLAARLAVAREADFTLHAAALAGRYLPRAA